MEFRAGFPELPLLNKNMAILEAAPTNSSLVGRVKLSPHLYCNIIGREPIGSAIRKHD